MAGRLHLLYHYCIKSEFDYISVTDHFGSFRIEIYIYIFWGNTIMVQLIVLIFINDLLIIRLTWESLGFYALILFAVNY